MCFNENFHQETCNETGLFIINQNVICNQCTVGGGGNVILSAGVGEDKAVLHLQMHPIFDHNHCYVGYGFCEECMCLLVLSGTRKNFACVYPHQRMQGRCIQGVAEFKAHVKVS